MSIDYFILLEEEISFEIFVASLERRVPLILEVHDGNTMRMTEASGLFRLYAKREPEGGNDWFDQCKGYQPKAKFIVTLNKERPVEAKASLARVVKAAIDCTSQAVTVLINGDTLLLSLKSDAERPEICRPGFWAEAEVRLLMEPRRGNGQ